MARRLLLLSCVVSTVVAAQTQRLKKDIPTIAKLADGSIVSIVMSDKSGKPIAQGSGFIVTSDGLIVTNYHVIQEGNTAIVKFSDGTVLPVDGVLAADRVRDLAVIKIHGKVFRTLTLGNSDRVQVGEEVVAIGNPLGLERTVSNGIVSGLRTDKEAGGKFLQTTAPISPGSSGGPLFNMVGEVIGINTMYLEGGENLNFAIPVNDAKVLLENRVAVLHNLPNEPRTKAHAVVKAKQPRFSKEFVRAAIITLNGLGTARKEELLNELRNVADLEKDEKLRTVEDIGYFKIALESLSFGDIREAFLTRVQQIITSQSVSVEYAMDLANAEPEYKAVLEQREGCIYAIKRELHDGYLDTSDAPDVCSDLKPLTAYRQSILCHISHDCGPQIK